MIAQGRAAPGELHTLIHWGFTDPAGNRAELPLSLRDQIMPEVLREYEVAEADPDFVSLVVEFSEVAYRLPWRLVLRREAYSADTLTWLGYRQADGPYSREESVALAVAVALGVLG